jgi:hypothetical protein
MLQFKCSTINSCTGSKGFLCPVIHKCTLYILYSISSRSIILVSKVFGQCIRGEGVSEKLLCFVLIHKVIGGSNGR